MLRPDRPASPPTGQRAPPAVPPPAPTAPSQTLSAGSAATLTPSDELKALTVLVQHGTQDPMIAVDRARESRERLETMGVDLEYHEYEMGHQIGTESSHDLAVWLSSVLKLDQP